MMPLVDTFFAATAMLVLYEGVDEATLRAIALADPRDPVRKRMRRHYRISDTDPTDPLRRGRVFPVLHDYRSTALFGHPLVNAGTTAAYVLMLFFGGDPSGRPFLKAALMGVQLVALVAFGGRTAIVLSGCPARDRVASHARRRRQRSPLRSAHRDLCSCSGRRRLSPPLSPPRRADLFANLVDRFEHDSGSTQARIVMLDLFNSFSLEDLLLGPNPERLASLQSTLGIEYGIENSWLGLVFQYGAIITVFFVLGLLALLGDFVRRTRPKSVYHRALFPDPGQFVGEPLGEIVRVQSICDFPADRVRTRSMGRRIPVGLAFAQPSSSRLPRA